MSNEKLDNHLFNKIQDILDKYQKATGISALIVDKEAKIIDKNQPSWFCRNYYCKNQSLCTKDHKLILNESLKWGGLFVYLCHKDFILWCVPIVAKKKLIGGVISGFVLLEQYKFLSEKYLLEFSKDQSCLKYITNQAANKFSNKLYNLLVNEKITDKKYLDESKRKVLAQREIAEKIIEKKNKKEIDSNKIYEKQDKLLNSIKYSETEEIRSNLNDVLSEIYLEGINNIKLLKFRMLELFVLISRTIIEYNQDIEGLYNLTTEYMKNSENLDDIHSFSLWLTDILNNFIEEVIIKRKKISRMYKAVEYIKNNLNKKLAISEVAWEVDLSESRFSYLFHKEFGISFSDYINKLKIEKAKALLNTNSYSIVEIALALNYNDQSYFTKIFKKLAGCTPKEYSLKNNKNNTKKK